VLDPYSLRDPQYWLGCAWFILLSAILWNANRYLLVRLRRERDWPDHPLRKVARLLAANVLTTVPVSVVMHALWYRFVGLELEGRVIAVTTLVIVLAVAFVSHVYETMGLSFRWLAGASESRGAAGASRLWLVGGKTL
jgi:hypothetical protein